MKRILLFLLLCSSTMVRGQLIDTLYRDWEGIAGFFKTDTGFLVVTGDAYLHFLDHDGKVFRTKYIEPVNSNLNGVNNVFKPFGTQADSFFYIATFDNHCDYFENFRLNKIDWNGNLLSFQPLEEWYFSTGRIVFPSSAGLPLFIESIEKEIILHYNNDSLLVFEFSNYVQKTSISEEGNLAVLTSDSLFNYEWVSGILSLKASTKFDEELDWQGRMDFVDNNILLSGKNKLWLFDAELSIAATATYAEAETIWAINIQENKIEVIIAITYEQPEFHIYDHLLNLEVKYFPEMSIIPFAFDFSDSILTLLGIEFFPEDKPAVAIHQTDLDDIESSVITDIALNNVHFISSESDESNCYFEPVRNHYINGITVELTNTGERTINEVAITSEKTYCRGFCWYEDRLFYHELFDIDLAPGESEEFFIPGALMQTSLSADPFKCLMAVFPDMRVDVDHSDNSFCFDVTTGIKDLNPSQRHVYPNPVQDILYLNSENGIKQVNVYDVNGVQAFNQEISDGYVDVSELVAGVYLIRAELANGQIYAERFVKL